MLSSNRQFLTSSILFLFFKLEDNVKATKFDLLVAGSGRFVHTQPFPNLQNGKKTIL